jgi:hypothetical protein
MRNWGHLLSKFGRRCFSWILSDIISNKTTSLEEGAQKVDRHPVKPPVSRSIRKL